MTAGLTSDPQYLPVGRREDRHLVNELNDAGNATSATDAELLLVERRDSTANRHRTVVCFHLDSSKCGHLVSQEVVGYSTCQFSVVYFAIRRL